jgi:hypothetical protein
MLALLNISFLQPILPADEKLIIRSNAKIFTLFWGRALKAGFMQVNA